MKHFFSILILLSIQLVGVCQTSIQQASNREQFEHYLWSYSKNKATSEKRLIDFDAINDWRTLGRYLSVSNDGKYFAYTINKHTGTRYWFSRPDSLVIQSTTTKWRVAFAKANEGFFTDNSNEYIFQNADGLCFLPLGSGKFQTIKNIGSYKVNEKNTWLAWKRKDNDSLTLRDLATGRGRSFTGITDFNFEKAGWLVCQNNKKELLIYNPVTNAEKRFSNVTAYSFSGSGKALLLKIISETGTSLQYITLPQGNATTICTTKAKESIGSYSMDDAGKRVAYNMVDSVDAGKSGIWYYEAGADKAVLKLNNEAKDIPGGLTINNSATFTDNGKYIQFSLQAKTVKTAKANEDMVGVEVWSSKELYLQSRQSNRLNSVSRYNAIVNIERDKVVFEENSDKRLRLLNGDFALVKKDYRDLVGDRFWEGRNYKDSTWVVSLKDGNSHLLPARTERIWFSPDGNWLIYFDASKGCHYYSYNLHTGELKNISATVANNQLGITGEGSDNEQAPATGNLAAWIDGETAVLVYDSYDIWKLDLTGKQPALNITNGFGKGKNTVLNLFSTDRYSEVPIIKGNEALVLRAFNRKNKQSGFYKKANLSAGAPTELYMGGYFMNKISGCHDPNFSYDGMAPMKATSKEVWIVQRQSTNDAPNYFATTDFKNFRRLTNYQPQAQYRWLAQELHSFKHLDGATGQGILYKPEGFDPAKKYPVVIAFYGQFSNNMYQFCTPNYLDQSVATGKSPIWFLNNGFLVFAPDIAVMPLKYGQKAFSCIEGAAKYLQHLSYVDANKLAFASHSWSSQLGAYLFTHSTSFSAASITEGFSSGNVISGAFALYEGYEGETRLKEVEEGREGGNFFENKAAWLDQTTVLNADNAKAALLLLSDKNSEYSEGQNMQLFMALRRLNKNAWWLKYDNGEHFLRDLKELKDYTIRYTQFFDHYLKNAPAPQWMTQGTPYKLKGIESRYELDALGTCNSTNGEPCAICEAWNKQYKKTPAMFQKEIKDWELDKDIAAELERKQNERRKQLDKEGEIQTKEVMKMLSSKK